MASKYPPAVDEAIWTLRTARPKPVPHEEIRARLAEGRAGLDDPHPIPKGTYWDHLRALRKARGHENDYVPEGGETETVDLIIRRAIGQASRELRELDESEQPSALEAVKIAERLAALKRQLQAPAPNPKRQQGGDDKAANARANPETLLERLARESREPATP
jgi:hypothetical protein